MTSSQSTPPPLEIPSEVTRQLDEFYATDDKRDVTGARHRLGATSVSRGEAGELARLVWERTPADVLEVGLALGGSAIAIAAARRARGLVGPHVALDPFQDTLSGRVGLLALEAAGLADGVDWRPEFSEEFLIECRRNGSRFDLIFIDGGHSIGQAVTDTFLAHDVLRPGGALAIHDAMMFSTMASVRHLIEERGYAVIPLRPDNQWKRAARMVKYAVHYGWGYGARVVPFTCRYLVALQKPGEPNDYH